MILHSAALILVAAGLVTADFDLGRSAGDSDLTAFVTRPEIRTARFNVTEHHPDRVVPGYFFVAPYIRLEQPAQPWRYYQACQTGPAIYDRSGDLVWSGACFFRNQNAYDFRVWHEDGHDHLSTILFAYPDIGDYKGHGVILDDTFTPVLPNRRALYVPMRPVLHDFSNLANDYGTQVGLINDLGIREIDLDTEEVLFEWWASDHISLDDSSAFVSKLGGPFPAGWDWIHLNSIDKNPDGDYLVSARYTDAIYKISGDDGSLLWTLGGRSSSLQLQGGFNFSRQHDARFISKTETTETISLLDNGADELAQTANTSSALVVTIDKVAMTARVDRRWLRPDRKLSRLRGNFQLLENGNAFVGWSDNGIISEFSYDGDLIMEASFASDRFVTYRTYKCNFTSVPSEPPILVANVYGPDVEHSVTVFHVSWNGATDVATWEFRRDHNGDSDEGLIGRVARTGFETGFQIAGYEQSVYALARNAADSSDQSSPMSTGASNRTEVKNSQRVLEDRAKTEL